MKTHSVLRPMPIIALVLALVVLRPGTGSACRIILPPFPRPRPMPMPPPQPMEVKSHRADIVIRDHVARVAVEAVFHNPNPRRIEGIYVFPVARDAAVSSFAMTVNGKTLEAQLLEADKARKTYEDIVRRLKDPALLEYVDQGLLKARVFPIGPNADVRVQLTYETAVRRNGTLASVVYPLLSARPGGGRHIGTLQITAAIEAKTAIKNVFVPGFRVDIARNGDRRAKLRFQAQNFRPERDFTILFSEKKGPVGVDFLAFRSPREKDGFFLMMIAPDSEPQAESISAKQLTFVLDTSGSMMGEKLRQAKKSLAFCVDALGPEDRFNIVAFATDVLPFRDAPVAASAANREAAKAFIGGLEARGGTAIDNALRFALGPAEASGRTANFVVFLTDGLPTVGETDPAIILRHVEKAAAGRRLFSFGVGYDVNTRLLDGIAAKTRGSSSYVRPGENLEIALSDFYDKIAYPVLTDLRLESGEVRLYDLAPPALPDLFKGSRILLTGRYRGKGRNAMVLSGKVRNARERFRFEADLEGAIRNAFIPRLWATRRVGYLQEQLRVNGKNQELIDEIKRLGRQYGILTEYTSFLVVADGIAPQRHEQARRVFDRLEVEAAARESGAAAVQHAMRSKALQAGRDRKSAVADRALAPAFKKAGLAPQKIEDLVRKAGDKTFYFRAGDGFWYDSTIPAGETPRIDEAVELWSGTFFRLVARHPELRRYVLAGEKLILELDGRVIRIAPGE